MGVYPAGPGPTPPVARGPELGNCADMSVCSLPVPTPAVDRVAIVIPARNEAGTIVDALTAVRQAVARVEPAVRCRVVVVDDGSTDATGRIAGHMLHDRGGDWRVLRIDQGCVGAARRIGIEAATAGGPQPERVWVLSTDADSTVRPDWIGRHLQHAAQGAPAVSGIVDLIDDGTYATLRDRWRADYREPIGRDHRHPYSHATNLGIRLDAYRAVGGFRDLSGEEDADLWRRLRAVGMEPRADARIVVDTSARRRNRVPEGFALALATLYPDEGPDGRRPVVGGRWREPGAPAQQGPGPLPPGPSR